MTCSPAQFEANRKNAQLSTGPRTQEGKNNSRANALKHGLCSSIVVPEDADAILERAEEIYQSFKPYTEWQSWNVDRAAVLTLRIERIERMERRYRDKASLKAELTWDGDRRLEVEQLGKSLAKDPAGVVEALQKTPHGCDWLMARWGLLAYSADRQSNQWTPEQTALAYDLLGTPAMFRNVDKPGASIDFKGKVHGDADDSAAVARRQVDELMQLRELVAGVDEVDRALAELDLVHDVELDLKLLRRYEATLHSRLRWSVKQMQFQGDVGFPDPEFSPYARIARHPALREKAMDLDEMAAACHDPSSPHPPFCLTPDEFPPPGEKPDIPAILRTRREKKIAKADARRMKNRQAAVNTRREKAELAREARRR